MARESTTTARRERFAALARQAQASFERAPRAYKYRLALLALLGYAVIFGMLAALVAIIGGTVTAAFMSTAFLLLLIKKKLIIVLGMAVWVLARALWVRFEAPRGHALTPSTAPALFEDLEQMRARLRLPRIHQVLLDTQFNAALVQTPRLGVFGWHRNTVVLGLPLLLAMSRDEARAVLAHELGHLSGNHSRFAGWIYRVRASWYRIMQAFDRAEGLAAGLLRRFFDWYAPYFDAMSFALARANEFEADAISAELTSSRNAANALLRTATAGHQEDRHFWGPLFERAGDEPEPERHPYQALARFHARHAPTADELRTLLQRRLQTQTDFSDTHPALQARLTALGESAMPLEPIAHSAAEAWLGEHLADTIACFDERWFDAHTERWRERHAEIGEQRRSLAELAARPPESLEPLQLWELACLTEQFEDDEQALALFQAYQRVEPEDPDADYVIGRILLQRDDSSGVDFMQRAQQAFAHSIIAAEHLQAYYIRTGDPATAEQWQLRAEAAVDRHHLAHAERQAVTRSDTLLDSGLDVQAIDDLRGQLAAIQGVKHAFIARKSLTVLAEESPLYVLCFSVRGLWRSQKKVARVRDAICETVRFPGAAFVVPLHGEGKAVGKRARAAGQQLL